MGFRMRKSIKLGGGVRLNLSKSGVGASVGGKYGRIGMGPRGTRLSANIPGTGIGYQSRVGTGRRERDSRRRYRELERLARENERADERRRGELAVAKYENLIERLQTVHQECGPVMDWHMLRNAPEPEPPVRTHTREDLANRVWLTYEPSLLDRLFRRTEKKKAQLLELVEIACGEDEAEYQRRCVAHERDVVNWRHDRELTERILQGDLEAYRSVLDDIRPLDEIDGLGSRVEVSFPSADTVNVRLHVHGEQVIPSEEPHLLKSGKVSSKKLSKTRFYEIYQDYVCSGVIRIAREVFACLPITVVVVTVVDTMLDTSTGKEGEFPVLSVAVVRELFETLDLNRIDPSDAMQNFEHRMTFRKTKGFAPVEPLHSDR